MAKMRVRARRVFGAIRGRAMRLCHHEMECKEGLWHNVWKGH